MIPLPQSRASEPAQARKGTWIYDSHLGVWVYDLWCKLTESRAYARALNVAGSQPGESVLEVAVGTGVLFAKLAGNGRLLRCVGLDQSDAMLSRASRHFPKQGGLGRALCRGDARFLPFADGTFDVIFNCYLMDLFSDGDIRIVLKEFRRALKPTGRVVLLVMSMQRPVLQYTWMWLYAHVPSLLGGCRPVSIAEYFAEEGWRIDVKELMSQLAFRSELILARPAC